FSRTFARRSSRKSASSSCGASGGPSFARRRISWPIGPLVGSTRRTTSTPAASSRAARRLACVVLPAPSIPSSTKKSGRASLCTARILTRDAARGFGETQDRLERIVVRDELRERRHDPRRPRLQAVPGEAALAGRAERVEELVREEPVPGHGEVERARRRRRGGEDRSLLLGERREERFQVESARRGVVGAALAAREARVEDDDGPPRRALGEDLLDLGER